MNAVEIARIGGCRCGDHAWVELRRPQGERALTLHVATSVGRALVAELRGRTMPDVMPFDMVGRLLTAAGAQAERLVLRREQSCILARMHVACELGAVPVEVDPCFGLLAACHLKVPIFYEESDTVAAGSNVPAVYHSLLESLSLDSLEQRAGCDETRHNEA